MTRGWKLSWKKALRDPLQSSTRELIDACRTNQSICTAHQTFLWKLEWLNLEKQLRNYGEGHANDAMYKWARMYMTQVMTLLQFQRATSESNWFLHFSALEKLCVYFFVYNRLGYAQNIPEYIARMLEMETTQTEFWQEFLKGEFTVNMSNTIPFMRIGVDQAMEHLSKSTKGQGGISGITSCSKTLLKFCLTALELARLAAETAHLVAVTNTSTTQHHRFSQSTVSCQERAIKQLKTMLAPCNLFNDSSAIRTMSKLASKEIIPLCET